MMSTKIRIDTLLDVVQLAATRLALGGQSEALPARDLIITAELIARVAMVKIFATEERTMRVRASISDVFAFFRQPAMIRELSADVESFETIDEHHAHWVLTEKVEKGVRFHADYTVEYHDEAEERVTWCTTAGNMDIDGEVKLRAMGPQCTEIFYRETVGPDLPITKLTALLFKPIVARELRQDIRHFLDRVLDRFGAAAD